MPVLIGMALFIGAGVFLVRVAQNSGAVHGHAGAARGRSRGQQGNGGSVAAIWAKARAEDWLDRRKATREKRTGRPSRGQQAISGTRSFCGWLRRTSAAYWAKVKARANRPPPAPDGGLPDDVPWLPGRRKARDQEHEPGTEAPPRIVPDGPVLQGVPVPSQRPQGPPRPVPRPDLPRPAPAPQTPPPTANGRTPTVATGTASAEKLIEGINEIHTSAVAGNIHAKHAAIKAAIEGMIRFAAMIQMLSRTLSENSRYGPEITEPLAKAGINLQAGAMSGSESDAALTTLINMTVGDLANSARQAPERTEFTESGAR